MDNSSNTCCDDDEGVDFPVGCSKYCMSGLYLVIFFRCGLCLEIHRDNKWIQWIGFTVHLLRYIKTAQPKVL